jgi:hypothetical protein
MRLTKRGRTLVEGVCLLLFVLVALFGDSVLDALIH